MSAEMQKVLSRRSVVVWGAVVRTGDEMAEFAINFLLTGRGPPRRLASELATRWPARPALEYVLVLSLAANGIEDTFTGDETGRLAQEAWRMAALVGVDLFDAQSLGLPHQTGADLIAYWQAHDPDFSPL
jgi:hypothetical protein